MVSSTVATWLRRSRRTGPSGPIRQALALAPRASFSRNVLERVPVVCRLRAGVRWKDWGTPSG